MCSGRERTESYRSYRRGLSPSGERGNAAFFSRSYVFTSSLVAVSKLKFFTLPQARAATTTVDCLSFADTPQSHYKKPSPFSDGVITCMA